MGNYAAEFGIVSIEYQEGNQASFRAVNVRYRPTEIDRFNCGRPRGRL